MELLTKLYSCILRFWNEWPYAQQVKSFDDVKGDVIPYIYDDDYVYEYNCVSDYQRIKLLLIYLYAEGFFNDACLGDKIGIDDSGCAIQLREKLADVIFPVLGGGGAHVICDEEGYITELLDECRDNGYVDDGSYDELYNFFTCECSSLMERISYCFSIFIEDDCSSGVKHCTELAADIFKAAIAPPFVNVDGLFVRATVDGKKGILGVLVPYISMSGYYIDSDVNLIDIEWLADAVLEYRSCVSKGVDLDAAS